MTFRRTYPVFAMGHGVAAEDAAAVARSKINPNNNGNERIISMSISLVAPTPDMALWLALAAAVIEARNLDENGAPL